MPDTALPPAWEKFKVIGVVLAALAVPVVLAVLGNALSRPQRQDELGVKYVELAIGILRSDASPESRNLRTWAVSVIDHYSQVPLPAELKADLELRRLQGVLTESMLRQQEETAHRLGGQSAAASAAAALKP